MPLKTNEFGWVVEYPDVKRERTILTLSSFKGEQIENSGFRESMKICACLQVKTFFYVNPVKRVHK